MTETPFTDAEHEEWLVQWNLVGFGLSFYAAARILAKLSAYGVSPLLCVLFEFVMWMFFGTAAVQTVLIKHSRTKGEVPHLTKGKIPIVVGFVLMSIYAILICIDFAFAANAFVKG